MNITIKNMRTGTRSYLGGLVTVSEDGETTLPRRLNVIIVSDATFVSDVVNFNIILNNGSQDLKPEGGLLLIQALAAFSTDKLATSFLYYSFPVDVVQSAGTNSPAAVWAMLNSSQSPYSFFIESVFLNMSFYAATPLVPTLLKYEFIRFTSATPSGGTTINSGKACRTAGTCPVSAMVKDTGLTMSGVSYDSAYAVISLPSRAGVTVPFSKKTSIELAPGEGLAIRLAEDAIAGLSISGEIVGSLR